MRSRPFSSSSTPRCSRSVGRSLNRRRPVPFRPIPRPSPPPPPPHDRADTVRISSPIHLEADDVEKRTGTARTTAPRRLRKFPESRSDLENQEPRNVVKIQLKSRTKPRALRIHRAENVQKCSPLVAMPAKLGRTKCVTSGCVFRSPLHYNMHSPRRSRKL